MNVIICLDIKKSIKGMNREDDRVYFLFHHVRVYPRLEDNDIMAVVNISASAQPGD